MPMNEQNGIKEAYKISIEDVAAQARTNSQIGLTEQEAHQRREKYGANILPEARPESLFITFLKQFQSPLIYFLFFAAVIIFFVGEDKRDAFIILGVLLFNATVGTIQAGRARNILASLKRFIKTQTVVIRDGQKKLVDDANLVVGDLIILQAGARVPADARIISSNNLRVEEAVLTGESAEIPKSVEAIDKTVPIGDQLNMAFRGTYILAGSAHAIVTAIGVHTQVGKIHASIAQIETEIPLQKDLSRLSYFILIFTIGACFALFIIGFATGRPIKELLVMLTALFICVVPEGLPVVLTLVLVTGAYYMAKRSVLAKKLQAMETLGRTDIVVIDKTGTLTRNEMMVSTVVADGVWWHVSGEGYYAEGTVRADGLVGKEQPKDSSLMRIGMAASLLNNAEIAFVSKLKIFDVKGDQTEAALYILSQKLGLSREQLDAQYKKIYEIAFDSSRKYHASFFESDGQVVAFLIGAPEAIAATCGAEVQNSMKQALDTLLEQGLRVVALAQKTFNKEQFMRDYVNNGLNGDAQVSAYEKAIASGCSFLGLCGIQDSVRPGLQEVVEQVRHAKLRVIMATGDHQQTALYVAKKVGIFLPGDEAIDGSGFTKMSDEELLARLPKVTVFSRVSPADKVRIIQLFHKLGKVVAMTGDGINDAPSLVAADLGIAMGGIGTEVAKQAADLVLLDDSFVNISNAIEMGRHILYALRRVILYFFATNTGEVVTVFLALVSDVPLPITAAQILWLNLVTDGFMDVSLAMEPMENGLLNNHWFNERVRLVDKSLLFKMFFMGLPMGVASFFVFMYTYPENVAYGRTMTLIVLAMFQWFNAWNCRSETKSIFQLGFFANRWIVIATMVVLFLQFAVVHAISFLERKA